MPDILGWLQGFSHMHVDNHPTILFRWVCFRMVGKG